MQKKFFELAEQRNLSVVIHTGQDDLIDGPRKFEKIITTHPKCRVQLCHVRNTADLIFMLEKYPNVVVDSAFSDHEEIKKFWMQVSLKIVFFGVQIFL